MVHEEGLPAEMARTVRAFFTMTYTIAGLVLTAGNLNELLYKELLKL
jgi:hypothetical protein